MESVSSDGGEYQDLPIIVDEGNEKQKEDENPKTQSAHKQDSMISSYSSRSITPNQRHTVSKKKILSKQSFTRESAKDQK